MLISDVDEKEIFKICLEYWNTLAANLYQENPFSTSSPLMLSAQAIPPRRQMYLNVLSKVCGVVMMTAKCVEAAFAGMHRFG